MNQLIISSLLLILSCLMIVLDNSTVEDITLEQGNGIVTLMHNAAITGSVTGGIIVRA